MRVTLADHRAMLAACKYAQRSQCKRLKVGCALVSASGQVELVSCNNNVLTDRECTGIEGACGCEHAESVALREPQRHLWCAPIERVYVTHQPCEACARLLIELGTVRMVRWLNPYRLSAGAGLLVSAGIDAKEWRL